MITLFLAQRVVIGKLKFINVPEVLKSQVFDHLRESNLEFLAGDYTPQ